MTIDQTELCHGLYLELELCSLLLFLQTEVTAGSLHSEEREHIAQSLFFLQVCKGRDRSLCFFSVNLLVICSGAFLSGFIGANRSQEEKLFPLKSLTDEHIPSSEYSEE